MQKCAFAFVCHKQWEELAQTDRDDARFCGDCNQRVFDISVLEGEASEILGRCARLMTTLGVISDSHSYFERDRFAMNVRLIEPVTDERAAVLRESFRALFDGGEKEEQFRDGEVVMLGHVKPYTAMILKSEFRTAAPEIVMWGADEEAQQMLASQREKAANADETPLWREDGMVDVPDATNL